MSISEKDLLEILGWLEASEWQELHLETATFKLTVSKTGRPAVGDERAASMAPQAAEAPARIAVSPPPVPVPTEEPYDPRWIAVRSPTLGNFYVAPKPGAPAFVALGQQVEEIDTVAIVEVMKLMNHVPAGAKGTIARICARNGELVEQDQLLFLIDPAASDG